MLKAVYARQLGEYGLSMPTDLSVGGLLNTDERKPNEDLLRSLNLEQYTRIYINVATLVRNIINSIDTIEIYTLVGKDIIQALIEDCNNLQRPLENFELVFYKVDYLSLMKDPNLQLLNPWTLKTDKQFYKASLTGELINLLVKSQQIPIVEFKHTFKDDVTEAAGKGMVITHVPYDLLAYKKLNFDMLLESNTGKLKLRKEWYTKYKDSKYLKPLPFNIQYLFTLGDNHLFNSIRPFRDELITLSEKYKMDPSSTKAKVDYALKSASPEYKKVIESINKFSGKTNFH